MKFFQFFANAWAGFFDKRLWQPIGQARTTTAKVDVSEDSALNYAAVWCATRLLCGTGAQLPLPVFESEDGERRKKIRSHPVFRLLNKKPNPEMDAFNFRSVLWQWQVNWGNAYAEIVREGDNPGAPVVELWPLHPARVKIMRDDEGQLYYEVKEFTGQPTILEPWQMLHIPSIITYDGIVGRGVIQHARETIGAGIAAEKKAAHRFGEGNIPAVVVEYPGKWASDVRESFRKEWKELYGGADGETVALLQGGATAKPLQGFSERDSQFLESRQFDVEEIARWYGIPPHLLQHLLRATFNNIEELGIDFVRYGLNSWLEIWEQAIGNKLFTTREQESLFVEHNVDALLRGNAAARANLYQSMTSAAIMTRNECRRLENLDPVEGGDVYLVQGAMVPLDESGKPESDFVNGGDGETGEATVDTTDVQATALNGAQISALLEIANGLAQEQLPREGTRAMLEAAFPLMDRKLIQTIVNDLDKFTPKPPPEPPAGIPDNPPVAAAIQKIMARDLTRILTKESNKMESCAKNPNNFCDQVDEFYTAHRTMLVDVVHESASALGSCGYTIDAGALATDWVNEGKSLMLEAAGAATPDVLPEAVKQVIESKTWSERPLRATERACNATSVV